MTRRVDHSHSPNPNRPEKSREKVAQKATIATRVGTKALHLLGHATHIPLSLHGHIVSKGGQQIPTPLNKKKK